MISRIFIILLFLLLPIVVALLSQRMASTVEPVLLPANPIEVKLLAERKSSSDRAPRGGQNAGNANDAPVGYTPRLIHHGAEGGTESGTEARAASRDLRKAGQNDKNDKNQGAAR